jgi:hypothetical protein
MRARAQGLEHVARAYDERADDNDEQADIIRKALARKLS